MKCASIHPVSGNPTEFTILNRHFDVAPFLELARSQSAETWFDHLDNLMLMLVELQASTDQSSMDGKYMYELFFDLRRLRDLFKASEISYSPSNPSSNA
jgi:hypothetical protein